MDRIINGVIKFQSDVFPDHEALFGELADHQEPNVMLITCADSRVNPSLITQSGPGDLFICRNAGNIVPPHSTDTGGMTASIEYAVAVLGVRHIIICGHTNCGAMNAALNLDGLQNLPHVKEWLSHARSAVEVVRAQGVDSEDERLKAVTEENVIQQLQHLRTHPAVAARIATGELFLHAWIYDIENGEVCCSGTERRQFHPIENFYHEHPVVR